MESPARYEILESIAQGECAKIYRGHDRQLDRVVAIKEILPQYLAEPQKLELYWQDLRLLASLQHPDIIRIEEVVPARGWVIEELAQESLPRMLAGRGIDMNDLRLTLEHALRALGAMHERGLIHGDVRPDNLLADQNKCVKLGDFNVTSRLRVNGLTAHGSTKYMAPEVASDRFGPIGPHSDLYSLGFAAYKLICGKSFEALFPGLRTQDRDLDLAWKKWHASPDKRAPELHQVVEGVPIDLGRVVRRLIEKDPANRYRTAQEALDDLTQEEEEDVLPVDPAPHPPTHEVPHEPADFARRMVEQPATGTTRPELRKPMSNLLRWIALAVLTCCLAVSAAIIFHLYRQRIQRASTVTASGPPAAVSTVTPAPTSADPATADASTAASTGAADPKGTPDAPQLVAVSDGTQTEGLVQSVDVSSGSIMLRVGGGQRLRLATTDKTQCTLNGRAVPLALLWPGDHASVVQRAAPEGGQALRIDALRKQSLTGWLVSASQTEVAVAADGPGGVLDEEPLTLPTAEDCLITLNGAREEGDRKLTLLDLRRQDRVTIDYDTRVHNIAAFRDVTESGIVTQVDHAGPAFVISRPDGSSGVFVLSPGCRTQIASQSAEFSSLQVGDRVTVERKSTEADDREAVQVSIAPRRDPALWALLLTYGSKPSPHFPAIRFAERDGDELSRVLRHLYRVPDEHLLREHNANRQPLQDAVMKFLRQVPPGSQLLVYFLGHGFIDPQGTAYLVSPDFDPQQPAATGTTLSWLVAQLEQCRARERVLVLDTTHDAIELPQPYPSAAELVESLKASPDQPATKTAFILASCGPGEAGNKATPVGRGLFAMGVCDAFSGRADVNHDQRVEASELHSYLRGTLPARLGLRNQTPTLFIPASTPTRLPLAAQAAVSGLLSYVQNDIDDQFFKHYDDARALSGEQPDAALAFGLAMMRAGRAAEAEAALRDVQVHHPEASVAHHLLAWKAFAEGQYLKGVPDLEELARRLPLEGDAATQRYVDYALETAGRLSAVGELVRRQLKLADVQASRQAIAARGEPAKEAYRRGYYFVRDRLADVERRLAQPLNEQERAALKQARDAMETYLTMDYEKVAAYLRGGLYQ